MFNLLKYFTSFLGIYISFSEPSDAILYSGIRGETPRGKTIKRQKKSIIYPQDDFSDKCLIRLDGR